MNLCQSVIKLSFLTSGHKTFELSFELNKTFHVTHQSNLPFQSNTPSQYQWKINQQANSSCMAHWALTSQACCVCSFNVTFQVNLSYPVVLFAVLFYSFVFSKHHSRLRLKTEFLKTNIMTMKFNTRPSSRPRLWSRYLGRLNLLLINCLLQW